MPKVPSGEPSHIFISYKRGVEPDEPVALAVYHALSQHHEVFIDQTMLVGTHWAERIEAELRRSDFLITFLTPNSINSEMVKGEIETAHHLGKQQGRPAILPVRLAYRDPFVYPLSAYLNGINWAFWDNPTDTPRLIQELLQAIAGGTLSINSDRSKTDLTTPSELNTQNSELKIPPPLPAAQPLSLEMPEGTMDPESQFYVARSVDAIALSAIQRQGVTITIKGPRQMGKSSLLIQVVDAAMNADKRVAFLDFQLLDTTTLSDADAFFRQFCTWLTDQLELPSQVEKYWNEGFGNNQRCTRYVQSYVLKELGAPLLLAMDEVDRMFETHFQSDFFSMLRSWHNSRALPTTRIWRNLDLALVTATEPYHSTARAVDGLVLAIQAIGQSRDQNLSNLFDTVDASLRSAAELAKEQNRLPVHTAAVWSVAFSPDGQRIVSGSWDNTVRLWDSTGTPIGPPFQGHTAAVWSVAFSPDGQRIVSGSWDNTVRLWHGSWQGWLQVGCNRLRHHPIFRHPEQSFDPEVVRQAIATCEGMCGGRREWGSGRVGEWKGVGEWESGGDRCCS
jgi:hypothetical protein